VRRLIERQLGAYLPTAEHETGLLANLDGPISAELRRAMASPRQRAAVLIGLVERSDGFHVVLTERARHLQRHAGQVAFPGGRLEHPGETPIAAALRESTEEIGLAAADVEVLGCLADHVTGTGFVVTPVVGFVDGGFEAIPDPAEVREVFEVPLPYVLDPANYALRHRERLGTRFRAYELAYDGHLVWGATAAMLVTFRKIIVNS